jgi:putative SOS response-associated peptidase YedK
MKELAELVFLLLIIGLILSLPIIWYEITRYDLKKIKGLIKNRHQKIENSRTEIHIYLKKGGREIVIAESWEFKTLYGEVKKDSVQVANDMVNNWNSSQCVTLNRLEEIESYPMHRVAKIVIKKENTFKWLTDYQDTEEYKELLKRYLKDKRAKKYYEMLKSKGMPI